MDFFPNVIRLAQIAFVQGRQISNAILLTQELMHNYHLNSSMIRYAWKIDIIKDFDTISQDFILTSLRATIVHDIMVRWIEVCMSTTYFSVAMNRESHDFFLFFRGFQHGDLFISLFVCSGY